MHSTVVRMNRRFTIGICCSVAVSVHAAKTSPGSEQSSKLFQWLFGWITVTVLKVSDKVNPRFSTAAIRNEPIHTSWFWQVHTDLILSLERLRTPLPPTAAHTHRLFICRSPAGLHGGNGWSGNRWRPVKYQRSELWVHLSINFSTGCPRAQSARVAPRRVTVKTQNKQWNAATDHVQR